MMNCMRVYFSIELVLLIYCISSIEVMAHKQQT